MLQAAQEICTVRSYVTLLTHHRPYTAIAVRGAG
jgi:hypothetical protein